MRTRACDTSTSSGTIAPGRAKRARADRLRHVGLRAETRRRELDRARLVHDERERARVYPRNSLARLIRHEPADPDAADGDAEGDRCGSRRWRRRRWNRRLRGWRLRGGSRWRLGRLTRRARSGARGRGEPEGGGESEKCAGDEERCADGAGRRFHVSSVDTNIGVNMRGSFVTTASTPRSVDPRELIGVVDRPRDDGRAPRVRRANARARDDRVMDARPRSLACTRAADGPPTA